MIKTAQHIVTGYAERRVDITSKTFCVYMFAGCFVAFALCLVPCKLIIVIKIRVIKARGRRAYNDA